MNIREYIQQNIAIFDGGMGSMLQAKGLVPGELPEMWNLEKPEIITGIHREYLDAGADIITTNTFGLNSLKFSHEQIERIAEKAIKNARTAIGGRKNKYVAFDIGPCGRMLKPWGDFEFEEAVSLFGCLAEKAERFGADCIIIETMNDSYETKAALLGVKENSNLPVFVSNAYGADGKLFTGAGPAGMVAMLEAMGADFVGANCSLGPVQLKETAEEILKYASVPVIIQPNAGLPKNENGMTIYDVTADEFARIMAEMAEDGVRILGGCCGTTPEYIAKLKAAVSGMKVKPQEEKNMTVVSSYSKAVVIGNRPVVIGERINPSGKKLLKKAIEEDDIDYILKEGLAQETAGADILDVNAGVPGIDEAEKLSEMCFELQSVCGLPLQIDSSDPNALEAALRKYNGKAIINSVNGKEESLSSVLPLAKKYGGVLVCLCLDENGIPKSPEERLAVAEKIAGRAASFGIKRKDLIFDALTLPVSADKAAADITLNSMRLISQKLGVNTVLGLSNVSFGLPQRDKINAAFLGMALSEGLSAAIINPMSSAIQDVLKAHNALTGFDENFEEYISYADAGNESFAAGTENFDLRTAIVKGLRNEAERLCGSLLESKDSMQIIQEDIIPALDTVGKAFEEKKMYLPQLLLSAETAQRAFEIIRRSSEIQQEGGDAFVIATVKGDIHDIGKNIVRLLLSNYGFKVTDLGKDVAPEIIADAVKKQGARLCGLSALMTTTVPAMEETIKLLKKEAPDCRIVVGGAVLTEEYAARIGADYYAPDAMSTVRYAQKQTEKTL